MTDILAPDDPALQSMADLFKVFGDPTRVRILFALFQQETCVQEIANRLGMTQSAISHQLRILKQARLVSSRREGKSIFYALADDHIYTIFRLKKSFLLSMENHLHFTRESAIIRAYRISLCEIWFPEVKQQWHIKSLMHVFLAVLVQTHVQ